MNKLNRGLEHFWLAITIGSTIYAVYAVYTEGWEQGGKNFFIPGIALMWLLFRRGMRKRMERVNEEQSKKADSSTNGQ
ncbi:MAG: hypothetical protein SGI87_06680 [Flavobacteriales bacterium]|nr:hypothetical protein [Flavobacteriales bacterium]